jgi:hypothetical protein
MNYQVKQQPKVVYDAITYQFTLTDESGKELEIRKWEDTKGGGYYIWNEETNGWDEFYPDEDLEDFILNDLDY